MVKINGSRVAAATLLIAALFPLKDVSAQDNKANSSSLEPQSLGITGGVCKADYGSTFNIDSKELTRTTCNDKSRHMKKLSSKLRQDLDMMRREFQQLQDLINEDIAIKEKESSDRVSSKGAILYIREDCKSVNTDTDDSMMKRNQPGIEEEVSNNPQFLPSDFYGQDPLYYVEGTKKASEESTSKQVILEISSQHPNSDSNFKLKIPSKWSEHHKQHQNKKGDKHKNRVR